MSHWQLVIGNKAQTMATSLTVQTWVLQVKPAQPMHHPQDMLTGLQTRDIQNDWQ